MTALVVMMNDTPVYVVLSTWERANEKCAELERHYDEHRPLRYIHIVEVECEEEGK